MLLWDRGPPRDCAGAELGETLGSKPPLHRKGQGPVRDPAHPVIPGKAQGCSLQEELPLWLFLGSCP